MIKDPEIDHLIPHWALVFVLHLAFQTYHSFHYGYVVPELVPSLMDDAFHEMDLRSLSESVRDCTWFRHKVYIYIYIEMEHYINSTFWKYPKRPKAVKMLYGLSKKGHITFDTFQSTFFTFERFQRLLGTLDRGFLYTNTTSFIAHM